MPGTMKILDSWGMKYTKQIGRLLTLLLTVGAVMAQGQAAFSDAASSVNSPESSSRASLSPAVNSTDDDQSILTIKKHVNEVNVLFIATDKHGKFVRNLDERDFNILDDHKPPESILAFRRETDLPIEMGLLVDVSGSVNSRFEFEQEAAVGFLQHVIRPGFD